MDILAFIATMAAVFYWIWGDYQSVRARNLEAQRDFAWDSIETIWDCKVEVEQRNAWLEGKRYVILNRFWRRSHYRHLAGHRILAGWNRGTPHA